MAMYEFTHFPVGPFTCLYFKFLNKFYKPTEFCKPTKFYGNSCTWTDNQE